MKKNLLALWIVGLLNIGYQASQAADNQVINFAANLLTPTCDMGQTGLTGTNNTLEFGNIDPTQVAMNPPASMQKSFNLTLTCNSSGAPGLTPKLKMTGTMLTNGNDTNSRNYLFNNGGATAAQVVGFIIVMNSTTPITWSPSQANNTEINLATAGGTAPTTIPVQVGISKGRNTVPVVSGDLEASVKFTFRYG